jgi:phosphoglucosamine mutase
MQQFHPSPDELGKAYRMEDARGRYIVFLKHTFPRECTLEGTRVVLDCANGATYRVAPATFFELGAETFTISDRPNGKNINVDCGSEHPEALMKEVRRRKADVGFAFDGDGDRLVAVDENGTVLTGDQVIAICANVMKKEGALDNNLVVRTVMSNLGLSVALEKLGIDSVMTKVGDRYLLEKMLERGAALGGEESGHVVFLKHHTTEDGILTALQVMAAMKKEGKPLSELAKIMDILPQVLINVVVKTKPDLSTIPEIVKIIKDVEDRLGTRGRVLVRYSGTQSLCRVMVEGPTIEETQKYCGQIADVVKAKLI